LDDRSAGLGVGKHLATLPPRPLGIRLSLPLTPAILGIAMAADARCLRRERARVLAQLERAATPRQPSRGAMPHGLIHTEEEP
jgi:hypothetical protein